MVATPGDPGNENMCGAEHTRAVEIAYGGTCTAGKKKTWTCTPRAGRRAEARQARGGLGKFYIQFGSQETREYCLRKGYLMCFRRPCDCDRAELRSCINAGREFRRVPIGGDQRPEPQFPRGRAGADVSGIALRSR